LCKDRAPRPTDQHGHKKAANRVSFCAAERPITDGYSRFCAINLAPVVLGTSRQAGPVNMPRILLSIMLVKQSKTQNFQQR
jgi:hypothetical protein